MASLKAKFKNSTLSLLLNRLKKKFFVYFGRFTAGASREPGNPLPFLVYLDVALAYAKNCIDMGAPS